MTPEERAIYHRGIQAAAAHVQQRATAFRAGFGRRGGNAVDRHVADVIEMQARAILELLPPEARDHPTMTVPVKLITEAHAAMRAMGWHLALEAPAEGSDGVLEAAAVDIEARFAALVMPRDTKEAS